MAQVSAGNGRPGPRSVEWTPWHNCASRDEAIEMVARKFLRERGTKMGQPDFEFTVWTYLTTDPLHPNGRPMVCLATTLVARTDEKSAA